MRPGLLQPRKLDQPLLAAGLKRRTQVGNTIPCEGAVRRTEDGCQGLDHPGADVEVKLTGRFGGHHLHLLHYVDELFHEQRVERGIYVSQQIMSKENAPSSVALDAEEGHLTGGQGCVSRVDRQVATNRAGQAGNRCQCFCKVGIPATNGATQLAGQPDGGAIQAGCRVRVWNEGRKKVAEYGFHEAGAADDLTCCLA